MKKLRNRLYIALLPLQMLLVGLAVWTFFVLANLGSLVVDSKVHRRSYARNLDSCLYTLRELNFVLETSAKAGSNVLSEDLMRIAEKYFANCEDLRAEAYLDTPSEIAKLWEVNDKLSPRIKRLLAEGNDPMVAENLLEIGKLSRAAELELEAASDNAVEEVLKVQDRFRERIRLSFIVLALGVTTGVIATILISIQIGRMILNPLEQLEARLGDVSEGKLDAEVGVVRSDEIGRLAKAFNEMLARLREYRSLTDQRLMNLTRTFRSVLQQNPHPIIFLHHDLTVFFANPPASDLFEAPEFRHSLPESLREIVFEAMEAGDQILIDDLPSALRINVGSQPRYFLAGAFPIDLVSTETEFADGPETEGIALLLQDVTRMKLADDIKGNLVATVSHELKTPLTSARMSLYLLSEQSIGELNEDQLELVETAKEDLERQLATIQNLLDLSRVEQGANSLDRKPCRANEIAMRSIQAHTDLARSSGVNLTPD
ncbi:MAG: histidine kinase dimerization/phospho-acceptor domain-containing protein, partial [Puniceicoccales bacterium]